MLNGECDMSPDQIRTEDIIAQRKGKDANPGTADDLTVTEDLGFHMGYIAWNIRDTATVNLNRSDRIHGAMATVSYWPLHDVEFRHGLIHSYNQLAIIPPIYGFIVTPVRSLVPPAQSKYYNTAVPAHPFNQGSPFATTVYNGTHYKDSCSILREAGYTFEDKGSIGVVDDADYWKTPGGHDMPEIVIYTPLFGDAPTSYTHGARFVEDLAKIGLAATTANGQKGLRNLGWNFDFYLDAVYGTADYPGGNFDAYMVFHGLGRLPDQLFSFLHSSKDCTVAWGQDNGPGVNDPDLDDLCEEVLYSIDTDDIEVAAKEIQYMLYAQLNTTVYPNADNYALAYMLLYSRSLFNVFHQELEGVVKSPGYGSDNDWTFLAANWTAGSTGRWEDVYGDSALESVMIYINGLPPDSLNPTFGTTAYEWNIMGHCLDGLTAVNPYNHFDIPWIATSWELTELLNQGPHSNETWMEVDFYLRDDVYWADGHMVNASNVEFNLEFFRDYSTINFFDQSQVLQDVVTHNRTWCTVKSSEAGLSLFYDYAGTGLVLPPQIWDTTWTGPAEVANHHPENEVYGPGTMGDGSITGHGAYTADPQGWGTTPTQLFGTGKYIFRTWDAVDEVDEMWANRHYFLTQGELATLMSNMFWEVGDYNADGVDNVIDLTWTSFAFGSYKTDPTYDAAADYNTDDWVNIEDVSNCAYHLLWQRTWP
jgi:ABC-type transport system substrate-binding protein